MKKNILNGGFIFASIINYLELTFLMGLFFDNFLYGLIAALPTMAVLYALTLTPLTDWSYRRELGLRKPNEREAKRIQTIWHMVVDGAKDCGIEVPSTFSIWVKDDNEPNACATGVNTIAINTAMLMNIYSDGEIAGVLGHELGHIVHGDTLSMLMSLQGSVVMNVIRQLYKVVSWIIENMFRLFFTILGLVWTEGNWDLGTMLGKIIGDICALPGKIIDLCIYGFDRFETAGYLLFCRQDEFAADKFSTTIGFGKGLRDNLARERSREKVNKFSLAYILQGTHPPTSERIERIEIIMQQMEENGKQENISEDTAHKSVRTHTAAEIADEDSERYSAEEQFKKAMQSIKNGERQQGIIWLEKAVGQNYAKAYIELGKCYFYGIGVKANKSRAAHYLQKSLEIGNAEGIYLLAECYASVGGDNKYAEAAFKCYYKSASLGCNAAFARVGLCCMEGKGAQKNEETAFNWLRTAVEKRNYQKAAYPLAKCYIQGIGTQKDIEKGIKILKKGIASGCDDADKAKQLLRNCTLDEYVDDSFDNDLLDILDD